MLLLAVNHILIIYMHCHAECLKRIDLMKVISSVTWGASSKILRLFYISYIRAKIDNGSMFYSTAASSNLKKLEGV